MAEDTDETISHGETVRLGLVLPSVNTIVEPWYAAILPAGHSIHVARMLLPEHLSPATVRQMDSQDGTRALHQIASVRPHAAIYACFVSSVVLGVEEDRALALTSARLATCPSETAAGASFAAMRAMGMVRIGVISPYTQEIDAAEHALLRNAGFEIAASHGFGIKSSFDLAGLSPAAMLAVGREMKGKVDGIFISCMNTPSHLAIAPLEEEAGVPVVTATSAALWAALRLAGNSQQIAALGRLGQVALRRSA